MADNYQQPLALDRLPLSGSHLIEASAGTGKTYSILRLYLRLLLEKQLPIEKILLVTFTRAASAELRSRLRAFLSDALADWEDAAEPVFIALRAQLAAGKARLLLQQALLKLDEAAIYTIHGFCQRALSQQAFLSGIGFNAVLETDIQPLLLQAVRDCYRDNQCRSSFTELAARWPTPEHFLSTWGALVANEEPMIVPALIDMEPLAAAFVTAWPEERSAFNRLNKATKRSSAGTLASYQEVLAWLDAAATGASLALPDRSQVKHCFSTQNKQQQMPCAFALLQAARVNSERQQALQIQAMICDIRQRAADAKTLQETLAFDDLVHRLASALNGINGGALAAALTEQFPAIMVDEFQDTDADQYRIFVALYQQRDDRFFAMIGDPKQAIYGFRGGDVFAYLQARDSAQHCWTMTTNYRSSPALIAGLEQLFCPTSVAADASFGFGIDYPRVQARPAATNPPFSDDRAALQWVHIAPANPQPKGEAKAFQQVIAAWVAQEAIHLLTTQLAQQAIVASDIALLVRRGDEARLLQDALQQVGVPAVYMSSRDSVFQTDLAHALLPLLQGIWRCENERLFKAALASEWLGLSLGQLARLEQESAYWSRWQQQFLHWRQQWAKGDLLPMLLAVLRQEAEAGPVHDQRTLSDGLHLAERLQTAASRYRGAEQLMHWLAQTLAEPPPAEVDRVRLAQDSPAVRIYTLHGAKGLEFPIVMLPFVSYGGKSTKPELACRYHDRDSYDLRLALAPTAQQRRWREEEEEAELARLLYVGATRAQNRLYICVSPFSSFARSMLGMVLQQAEFRPAQFAARVSCADAASLLDIAETAIPVQELVPPPALPSAKAAQFSRLIEQDWRLHSFSALVRQLEGDGRSLPDRDEAASESAQSSGQGALRFRLQKGAETGNLLHDSLEHCQFQQPDFSALWRRATERYSALCQTFSQQEYSDWLTAILQTPLQQFRLADLGEQAVLKETEFYFPIDPVPTRRLADFISARRKTAFQLPPRQQLKGMMHGYIDLIFQHQGRYYLADYKTTHLGQALANYQQAELQASVWAHNYDLQYSLYALALHRYLGERLADYQPQQHFGGVYYLYLRGMQPGAQTGLFFDSFTPTELAQLDAIFGSHQGAH